MNEQEKHLVTFWKTMAASRRARIKALQREIGLEEKALARAVSNAKSYLKRTNKD